METKKKLVIIGGGFAGLNLMKKVDKDKFDVALIDRHNFHSFPPLFYQIASSGLDEGSICFPFRREIRKVKKGVRFHLGEVKKIDSEKKTVTTSFETIEYDYLVIAMGCTNNFFGMNDLLKTVFTLKSTAEAVRTRNEILDRLEKASICEDPERRKQLLNFVVIGGGPTGVEIAGALGEMKKYILAREYPELNSEDVHVMIVEGAPKLLSSMSERSSHEAEEYLKQLLVDVHLNKMMESYDGNVIKFKDGSSEYSEMVIWTAGIVGEPIQGLDEKFFTRGRRVVVDEYNRINGTDNMFALGDIACMITDATPKGHPQIAQVALQQAVNLAKNLNAGEFKTAFKYKDLGTMATVGRNRAVADLNSSHLYGRPAWLVWMFIHLISLLGMRNKASVLMNWIWNYVTYGTSLRLLIRPVKYPTRHHWDE